MALSISLTNSIGIVTKYHRILKVEIYKNKAICTVGSYADKSYRDSEKKRIEDEYTRINNMYEERVKNGDLNPEFDRSIQLFNVAKEEEKAPMAIDLEDYEIPFESSNEISFKTIYKLLKKEDKFKDATDC